MKISNVKTLVSRTTKLLPGRWFWLLSGLGLVTYGIGLVQAREPRQLPINETYEIWNVTFKLEIVNIQNLAVALPYLLTGMLLCIFTLLPNTWKQTQKRTLGLQRKKLAPSYLYPRLTIITAVFVFLIVNLWQHKFAPILLWGWVFALVMLTVMFWQHDRKARVRLSPKIARIDLIWLLVITSLALWIGALKLNDIPAIMIPDEGSFWETARAIALGEYKPVFFDFGVYTFPVASSILQGWLMRIFGVNLWGWRFSSVLVATAALTPLYLLARELFDRRIAVTAAFAMLFNPYFLAFARMGYNNAQAFLPVTLGLYFFSLAYKRSSPFYYWLAGLAAALGFYTYPAAWLGLLTIGLALIFLLAGKRIQWRQFALIAGIIVIAVFVLAGPRFIYGASGGNSHSTFFKILETSFLSDFYGKALFGDNAQTSNIVQIGNNTIMVAPELYGELLTRGFVRTLAALIDPFLVSEHFITANLAGGLISAIFFTLGLSLSLRAGKQLRFALLLFWLIAGLFFLSIIAAFPPRHTHLVSIIPVLALLTALGVVGTIDSLREILHARLPKLPTGWASTLLILTTTLTIMYSGIREYFVIMPERNPPIFEDTVSWIAWREEKPLQIVYVSAEDVLHRVEYLINTRMIFHSYKSVILEDFTWSLAGPDSIVFLEWPQEELPEELSHVPPSFTQYARYTLPDGRITGYAWANTAVELHPNTSIMGFPVIPLGKVLILNAVAILLYFLRIKISLQEDNNSAVGKRLVLEFSLRRSEALKKGSEKKMKTVLFHQHGGPEVLQYTDFPDPEPKPGQALVKLHAAALNRMDVMVRNGWPGLKLEMPHINGADGAGEIVALGSPLSQEDGSWVRENDRVVINANLGCGVCDACLAGQDNMCKDWHLLGETVRGTYAEYVCLPLRQLYKLPDDFSYHKAAAAALVYQTAWHSLITRGKLQAGETVLVVGAGGGVNTASIDIAKFSGAQVIVVGSDAKKLQGAEVLGADVLIDRSKEENWSKAVYLATNKQGVDVVVDNVGITFMQSLRTLKKGGRLLTVGNSGGPKFELDNRYVFAKHLSIIGSTMSNLADFKTVMDLLVAGKLNPLIDKTFPLQDAAAAQERLWRGENIGKITLSIQN
ncbi:MAG: hypothetical protein Kow002_09050 [Anaerolineales bacterium]